MKRAQLLIAINFMVLAGTFASAMKWLLSERGAIYLSGIGSASQCIIYALLGLGIVYSFFLLLLLMRSSAAGVDFIVMWDMFLALLILVAWFGGYASVRFGHGMDVELDWFSAGSLQKLLLSMALLACAWCFARSRVASSGGE